jgi:hypothetical protein
MRGHHRWTDAERETLKALHETTPTREMAHILGRSTQAVGNRMILEGLRKRRIRIPSSALATIRELNHKGWSDSEIAESLGSDRHCVSRRRKDMGLPSNARNQRYRDKIRAGVRRQCEAACVKNMGEYRALMHRVKVLQSGWPRDLRMRSVQILNVLDERGPMTRRQIAEAVGMPWHEESNSLTSNDSEGTYLAHLQARGLVMRLGRIVLGKGRGKSVNLYSLTLNAQRSEIPCGKLEEVQPPARTSRRGKPR